MDTKYYDALEVHPGASPEVIRAAYQALMKVHHPDKKATVLGARAKALNEAYEVLSDAAKREEYDRRRTDVSGTVIDGVRIDAAIAEGGFGKTYKGTHLLTGMPVCVKHCSRISPEDAAILVDETKAMWDLRHYALPAARNLVRLDDGSLALFMSYIEGPTLEKLALGFAAKGKRIPAEHVAWITSRILNALSYIHRHGVVHGDLKPLNVIVQAERHAAFLVDFGLAAVRPTRSTGSKGYTDLFSPPEQVRGDPLNPQTDFYSLGMTMLFALTGDMGHTSRREVPSDVPDALCKFILRLIVRDPANRPDWRKEDVIASFEAVRMASFGRTQSGLLEL
jgi:serine/threonine protein kinase